LQLGAKVIAVSDESSEEEFTPTPTASGETSAQGGGTTPVQARQTKRRKLNLQGKKDLTKLESTVAKSAEAISSISLALAGGPKVGDDEELEQFLQYFSSSARKFHSSLLASFYSDCNGVLQNYRTLTKTFMVCI